MNRKGWKHVYYVSLLLIFLWLFLGLSGSALYGSFVAECSGEMPSGSEEEAASRALMSVGRSMEQVEDVYGVTGQPSDRVLVVCCVDGSIYGLDPLDGSVLWKSKDPYGPYVTSLAHPGLAEALSGELYLVEAIGNGALHYFNGQEGGLFYRLPLSMRQLALRTTPYRCPDGRYVVGSKRSNIWHMNRMDGSTVEEKVNDKATTGAFLEFVRSDYMVRIKEGRRKKDSRTAWSVAFSEIVLDAGGKNIMEEEDDTTTSVDLGDMDETVSRRPRADKWYKASLEPCNFKPHVLRLSSAAKASAGKSNRLLPSFQVAPHLVLYSNLEDSLFARNLYDDEIEWQLSVSSPVIKVFQYRWKAAVNVVPLLGDAVSGAPGGSKPLQNSERPSANDRTGRTSPLSSALLDDIVRITAFPWNVDEATSDWLTSFLFPNESIADYRQLYIFPDLSPSLAASFKGSFPPDASNILPWMYGRSLDYFSPDDSLNSYTDFSLIQRSFLYFPKYVQQRLMVGGDEDLSDKHKLEGARLLFRSPNTRPETMKQPIQSQENVDLHAYLPNRLLLEASSSSTENENAIHQNLPSRGSFPFSGISHGWLRSPYLLLPPPTPIEQLTVSGYVEGNRSGQGWFAWVLTWFILISLTLLLLKIWLEGFSDRTQKGWLSWILFWRSEEKPIPSPLVISDEILGYGSHGTVVFKGTFQISSESTSNLSPKNASSPLENGRTVAIKRFLLDFYSLAEHEVRLLTTSDHHPNILRYFYHERRAPFLYLALEYCPATLLDLIDTDEDSNDMDSDSSLFGENKEQNGEEKLKVESTTGSDRLPLANVRLEWQKKSPPMRSLLRGLMEGIHHLHQLGIVHRDMKPANVLCSLRMDRLLISDFGVSKHVPVPEEMESVNAKLSSGSSSGSPTGKKLPWKAFDPPTVCGTVGWRAPELLLWESLQRFERDKTADEQSTSPGLSSAKRQSSDALSPSLSKMPFQLQAAMDVFSAGCLLFYTLTGGYHPYGQTLHLESNIIKGESHYEALYALFPLAYPELYKNIDGDTVPSAFSAKRQSQVWVKQWLGKEREPCLPEAYDLICRMIHKEAGRRPTMAQVLAHPFFWTSEKRLAFVQDVSDRLSMTPEYVKEKKESEEVNADTNGKIGPPPGFIEPSTSPVSNITDDIPSHWIDSSAALARSLQHIWKTYPSTLPVYPKDMTANWLARLDPVLASLLRHDRRRSYHPAKLSDLLRALRNKRHHYQDLPLDVRSVLGSVPDGFLMYWTTRFPMLVLVCWQAVFLSGLLDDPNESVFRSYFVLDT